MAETVFFDDLQTGQSFATEFRDVTAEDIRAFADLSGDHNAIHEDPEAARAAGFSDCIAHGLLVLSIATGLRSATGMFSRSVLAFLGIENWRFQAPVTAGDRVRVRWRILDVTPSRSKPDRGVVRQEVEILNQRDEIVQSGIFVTMMRKRPV